MAEDYKLKINVRIGDRTYPMSVRPEDEEKFRRSAKEVTSIYSQYGKRVLDPIDRMAFVAFNIALKADSATNSDSAKGAIERLNTISKKISESL